MATALSLFSALDAQNRALLLAAFSHQLTILAREGYEVGTERLSNPELLRRINEVQHKVSDAIMVRLSGSQERYSDDALMSIFAGSDANEFTRQLHRVFQRAWQTAFGVEITNASHP